jgi:hypothetical protein
VNGQPKVPRTARGVDLTFDRPHAVVALARGGAWAGVPLVHAWVDGESELSLGQADERER